MSRIALVSDQPLLTPGIDLSGLRRLARRSMAALRAGVRGVIHFASIWYL